MRLDQRYFERVAAKQHIDCILESYRAVHARSTMVLFSRTTRTPLAALTLKSKDVGCLSMVTGRPSPARNPDQPYFQGMLNLPNSDFTFVITNLSGEGMVNFNVLHTPHRVSEVDPGPSYGINEVNELNVGQSYEIEADQRTGRGMVLKGKTEVKVDPATRERKVVPLTVEGSETTKEKSKEGLYFYLSVVPDASSKALVSKFSEGTAWRAAPGFMRRVAALPAARRFYRHRRAEEAERAPVQRTTPRVSPNGTAALPTREALALDPARSARLTEEMAAPARSAKRSFGLPSFAGSFWSMPARSRSGSGFRLAAQTCSDHSHRAEPRSRNSAPGAGAGAFGSTSARLERGSSGVDRLQSLRPRRSGSSSSGRSAPRAGASGSSAHLAMSMPGAPPPCSMQPTLLDDIMAAAIDNVTGAARSSASKMYDLHESEDNALTDFESDGMTAAGREVSHRGDSPARHRLTAPVEVGSTQAGVLDYGERVHVRSGYTGREYAYERASEPTVLCLSIWEGMKFLPLVDSVEAMLEAEVQEWVKNEGKALIASLNAVYREEKCIIDLESKADTIVCTCGHQCINHANVTNDLRRCPICRSPVTAFVRADGIVV